MTPLQSAFINIINLGIAASFLMLAVILLRPFLKRVPRWLTCVLWGMVALRLVIPFSFESRWSLVPAWKVSVLQENEGKTAYHVNLPSGSEAEDWQGETVAKNSAKDNHAERAQDISAEKSWKNPSEENAGKTSSYDNDGISSAGMEEFVGNDVMPQQNDQYDNATSKMEGIHSEGLSGNEITTAKTGQQADGQGEWMSAHSGAAEGNAVTNENIAASGENAVTAEGITAAGEDNTATGENNAATPESMLRKMFEGVLLTVGSSVWMVGILAMLAYVIFSYVRLYRKVRTAARLESDRGVTVWMSDAITEPFVLGIVRPSIYVPSTIGESDLECVLSHERAHVRRGDYLWKPIGFLILCIYWFHPLCWISYLLFCRDVEMACDEKATKDFDMEERKRYCQTLLNLSQGKKNTLIGTVAFGENGTKSRVKAVLNYKKPSFWIILAGVLACLAVGIFFMTNRNSSGKSEGDPSQTADASAKTDASVKTNEPVGTDVKGEPIEVKDNVTLFQAVLLGERNFDVVENNDCLSSINIADVSMLFHSSDPNLEVFSFAVVDLDRDGEEEVILFVISAADEGRVILRRWGNMVYAYVVDSRSMWNLKTDGTYEYNTGNVNDGFARITCFTETDYIEDPYTYETGASVDADTFVVNHVSTSENAYKKAVISEQGKKKAVWHELNEENVLAMEGDFQKRVTWINPAILWQQVLKEISEREFLFHDGASNGGSMVIREDGSFSGAYTRREDSYYYLESRFTGNLEFTECVDEYTWRVKVSGLRCEKEIGSKWKEDGFTYEEILPPGMTEGGEYLLCLPGKPVEELPRGILYWRGTEIEKAGAWTAYGIGAIPNTAEEAYTDLSHWKNDDLIGYGEDLALYCRSIYPSVMQEWGVKALSPDLSKYLYGKSENQDGKTILTVGVIDAHEYQRPKEFQLNTESSNEIVKVYWLSDTLVGAETHVNPSTGEFFIYDLETGKEVKHYVGASFAVIPGTSYVMYEENVPHFFNDAFCHSFYIDDQRVYTSDWMSARLGKPTFSDDLTKLKFMEQRYDLGVFREVTCDFDLQTLTFSNIQAQLIREQTASTPDRQEVLSAYNSLIHLAEVAIYDPQANGENAKAYLDADGKDLFSMEIRWLFDGSGEIAWQSVGYWMQDIDGDGVEELFFGVNDPDPYGSFHGVIYDMYTYLDHQLVHLFSGWVRNRYYLTEEGLIAREAESSAYDGRREYYQYDGAQLLCQERIEWEIQNDGTKVIAYSDVNGTKKITEKEMNAVMDQYHYVTPKFLPMGPTWSKMEDINEDGWDDYLILFYRDGICHRLSLYLMRQGIVYDREADEIGLKDYQFVDVDGDGEKEIVLTLDLFGNSVPLEESAVLKKVGDVWKEIE